MQIIDMHVHLFPDALARRALPKLAVTCNSDYYADGTAGGTKANLQSWGVTNAAVLNIATKPAQQGTINRWAAQLQQEDPFFYCFGSVHPDADDAVEELRRIKSLGLHGVKFHPDYQSFLVEEKRLFPLYEELSSLGMPVTFHAGADPLSPTLIHTKPHMLAKVARQFPKMIVIAAHLGGLAFLEESESCLAGLENVYLDTAIASRFCPLEQMRRMIYKHGAERILFASDCPWSRSCDELGYLERLNLPARDMDKILYQNALELLKR